MAAEGMGKLLVFAIALIFIISLTVLTIGGGSKILLMIFSVIASIPNIISGAFLQAVPTWMRVR